MKIKKNKSSENKLFKLQALKLHSKNRTEAKENFTHIKTQLNKISNIIYKYNKAKKKILFLGFPANFKNVLKNTKHKDVPEFLLFHGLLSKQENLNEITKKKLKKLSLSTLKLVLKIKKLDLIIIYNQKSKSTAIQESYTARIPTITLSKKLDFSHKTTYELLGNYELLSEKSENNNFFLSFLKTVLTKAKLN
jgi:ribosomal protein S2